MSNIGNQVVAVVATLLGFLAHDYLDETGNVVDTNANVIMASVDIDPVVTRSVAMDRLSLDAFVGSAIAPAAMPKAPAAAVTARGGPIKSEDIEAAFARVTDVREIGSSLRSVAPQDAGDFR